MLDIFYPGNFQKHNRNHKEWSIHHWLDAKQKPNLVDWYYKGCTNNIYQRAISFGLRPEFAQELANM